MEVSVIEQLASKGIVIILRKGMEWQVQIVRKNENGFLTDKKSELGNNLENVISDLLSKVM
jgi:hypothetical protein